MRKESRDTPEVPLDPELESDLGPELEMRGDRLMAEIEEAREEAARNLETAQRAQAEFDNFRKRMARDHADAVKRAGERIVGHLLPVVDNLERAIDHVTAGGDQRDLLSGVEMVLGQLLDVLAKEGVEQADPFGQPFDALKHQAVGQKEDLEMPEGTVVEVFQKGYEMHGRTIRPAMVVVSTGGPQPEE
ncbi:MAG: nucleotide exchange factor GrpE [Coriobacteriia bacterium]|nr:nucleotide exchange factor GrpE [Coriobacteriia bacterium]